MCLYPRLIQNKKYQKNKKNKGEIPPCQDERVKWVSIGCQHCIECRKQKSREWQVRLQEEIKTQRNGKFVTLTYSTESIKKYIENEKPPTGKKIKLWKPLKEYTGYDLDNELATRTVRHFLERWRKKYKTSVRHWLVTELGRKGHSQHMHLHGIIWTDNVKEIEKIWGYGYVWKGYEHSNGTIENYVNAKTINYIIKYITKIDEKHPNFKSKILTSPGIGNQYTILGDHRANKYKPNETKETYRTISGHKIALPIYWRNKIYTEEEREKLWIEKLDKGDRYVCGEKTNTNEETDTYYNLLNYHRERTKKLGYQDPEIIWEKKSYEEQQRQLIYHKRFYEEPPE